MKYIITITKQDFLNNNFNDNCNCPCAQALKKIFPQFKVSVGGSNFILHNELKRIFKLDFDKCDVQSHTNFNCEFDFLEELIYNNANSKTPEEVVFSFEATLPKI